MGLISNNRDSGLLRRRTYHHLSTAEVVKVGRDDHHGDNSDCSPDTDKNQ